MCLKITCGTFKKLDKMKYGIKNTIFTNIG